MSRSPPPLPRPLALGSVGVQLPAGLTNIYRQATDRTSFPNYNTALTGQTNWRGKTRHHVFGALSDPVISFGNFSGIPAEADGTQDYTVRCAIQSVAQTNLFRTLTYQGGRDMTLAPGKMLSFDPATGFDCFGDVFVHTRVILPATSSLLWTTRMGITTAMSEAYAFDQLTTDNTSDKTAATGAYVGGTYAFPFMPLAIKGRVSFAGAAPMVAVVGDSIATGLNDTTPNTGNVTYGYAAEALDGVIPWGQFSTPSAKCADWYVAAHRRLNAIMDSGATHAYLNLGINDIIAGGSTFAGVQDAIGMVGGILARRGIRVTIGPMGPKSNSSDNWATVGNQTPATNFAPGGIRAQINAWLRAGPSFASGFVETADPVETARDSGIWANPTYVSTSDGLGLHPTPAGHAVMAIPLKAWAQTLPSIHSI